MKYAEFKENVIKNFKRHLPQMFQDEHVQFGGAGITVVDLE